ncbi:hypothetical protein V2J09_017100 [Rumex salicifolius]
MADTRLQSLIEMNRQLEEIRLDHSRNMEELNRKTDALREELNGKFAHLESILSQFLTQNQPNSDPQSSSGPENPQTLQTPPHNEPPDKSVSGPLSSARPLFESRRTPFNSNALSTRLTKIDFPKFDGTLIKEWIYRCEQFFMIDNTAPELKVRLASIHLEGKALQWHHTYIHTRFERFPSWPEYVIDISSRFGPLYDDPLVDLVNLKQATDSVDDFLDKFECALTRLHLPIAHALSVFLANLSPHLQLHVRQFKPTTLADAARVAKLHESSIALAPQKITKPFSPFQKSAYNKASPLLPTPESAKPFSQRTAFPSPKLLTDKPARKFSYEEMQERKTKGLCMFCEEPYTPGHHIKHKRAQIFLMEADEEDPSDEVVDALIAEDLQVAEIEQSQISVHALNGSSHFNCMHVTGYVGRTKIQILIDPGSTHNFVNLDTAKLVGCRLNHVKPLLVAAVGHKLVSEYICHAFSWKLHGYDFSAEVRTLPLDCCDLVLGIQWLTTVGPVWWDFVNMRMEFMSNGHKHVLRGINPGCKVVKGSSLNKILLRQPEIALLQLCEPTAATDDSTPQLCHINTTGSKACNAAAVQTLLNLFAAIDPMLQKLISELQLTPTSHPAYTYVNSELRRHGKLVIGNDSAVKLHIFRWLHDSAVGGHSGRDATLRRG